MLSAATGSACLVLGGLVLAATKNTFSSLLSPHGGILDSEEAEEILFLFTFGGPPASEVTPRRSLAQISDCNVRRS